MAHYAKLDENNIVIDVIVIADRDCLDENGNECEEPGRRMCEALTGHAKWKKTSYNTRRGVYYKPNSDEPDEDQSKAFRFNYARIGLKYDEELDGFIIEQKEIKQRIPRMIYNPKNGELSLPKPPIPVPEDLKLDEYPLDTYQEPWYWHEHKFEWVKLKKDEEKRGYHFLYEDMI
jgi:hypothetical protein